jgi:hypothetical protein
MLATLPLAKLPFSLAASLWVALLSLAVVGALRALRVRDLRCYAAVLISAPVFTGIAVGNVTPLIVLSAALTWRWRDRAAAGAGALAFGLVVKPILWPVVVWAFVTRRVRLGAGAVALAVVVDAAGWAVISFHGLRNYPSLMSSLAHSAASHGLLLTSALVNSGVRFGVAIVPSAVLASILLISAVRTRDDRWIFAASLAASLLLTPVMWIHYLSLLFVPIATWRRRLDLLWLAPIALWLVARVYHQPDHTRPVWTSMFALASAAFIGWRLASASSSSKSTHSEARLLASSTTR